MGQLSLRNVFVRGHASSSRVIPAPVADFTVGAASGVFPLTVNFTDTSTNNPTSWAWDFTNDGTVDSTTQNPTHIYSTPGTYTVKLTATNSTGSGEVTKTGFITVLSPVYTLSRSAVEVNEGASITITLSTQYVSPGTIVPYTISGTGITTADINGASLTGTFVVSGTYNSGTSSVTLNITADTLTEGAETITLSIEAQAQTISVVVNDTSITPAVIDSNSVYFDGIGDYLDVNGTSSFGLNATNFTIEAWFNISSMPTSIYGAPIVTRNGGSNGWELRLQNTAKVSWGLPGIAGYDFGPTISTNTWYHVAVVKSNGVISGYVNGVKYSVGTNSAGNAASRDIFIGYNSYGYFNGYISNVRIVNGTALYTSAFTPPNQPLTAITGTTLLTCQSDTIVDNSTNNFAIAVNGDAIRSPFSPFESNGDYWSGYFDGNGDSISIADNNAFNFGTGNFTVECWVNINNVANNPWIFTQWQNTSTTDTTSSFYIISSSSKIAAGVAYNNSTSQFTLTSRTTIQNGQWYHVALVRNGSTTTLYLNGVAEASNTTLGSMTVNNGSTPVLLGMRQGGLNYLNGYVSNARIVKGTAVYTSNFAPSAVPSTKIANTQLLTVQTMNLVDNSDNNFAVTSAGNATMVPTSPLVYDVGYYSNYFDGNGDYLSIDDNPALELGSNNFTIELWMYAMGSNPSNGASLISKSGTNSIGPFAIGFNPTGFLAFSGSSSSSAWGFNIPSTTTYNSLVNKWSHLALVRNGNNFNLYLNGTPVASTTFSGSLVNNTEKLMIGYINYVNTFFTGYVSNVRIVNGTAVYTSNFTPSTTPLTAISGTSLLTCQSQGFRDNSTNDFAITALGNTTIETFNPFNSNFATSPLTWSTYFDGSGDYLTAPSPNLSGDWTVECWWYPSTVTTQQTILSFNSGSFTGINISCNNSGRLMVDNGSTGQTAFSDASIQANRWNHIAVSRSGSTTRGYINGVLAGSNTFTPSTTNSVSIGRFNGGANGTTFYYLNGYLSNVRVVTGTALYTGNFTPSTTPLTPVAGTKLLTCQTATIESTAIENVVTVTAFGNAIPRPVSPF